MIVAVVNVKWSDYDEKNTLQIGKRLILKTGLICHFS